MFILPFIRHPVVMLFSVGVIVVAGETSAGLFAQFFVMNLLTFHFFAVLLATGLLVLFSSYFVVNKMKNNFLHHLLNCVAVVAIMLSVFIFFYRLPWPNFNQTFTDTVPLLTLIFGVICTTAFLLCNLYRLLT